MMRIQDNAAYIVKRIKDIWGEKPGKKILQKMIYIIENKGIYLGYEYELHFYGPYSGTLDATIKFLSADGVIEFDYSGYSHLMGINEEYYEIEPNKLTEEQKKEIDVIIKHFEKKSPSELELLTTIIYAYDHLNEKTEDRIISGVQKIKGSKYSKTQIQKTLENLQYFNKPIEK